MSISLTPSPATRTQIQPNTMGRLWSDAPQLMTMTVVITLAALPILAAMALDDRQFQGENIWIKPLKFHIALAIYTLTLAFYARFLPAGMLLSRKWRMYQAVVIAAIAGEILWIGGAAGLGTASHFNISTPFWNAAYALMGMAAVTLTSISLLMGIAFWKTRANTLHLALALGLGLTLVLTVLVAGTMSSGTGHHVGIPLTNERLPIFGWSREVGDLRVPHFLATHAMHGIPLAALTGSRALVWGAALAYTALVLATYAQALMGLPLI